MPIDASRARRGGRSSPRSRLSLTALALTTFAIAGGCDGCSCFRVPSNGNGCASFDDPGCTCADGSSCGFLSGCDDDPADCPIACGGQCCEAYETCALDGCHARVRSCNGDSDCADGDVCDPGATGDVIEEGAQISSCAGGFSGACVVQPPRCGVASTPDCLRSCALEGDTSGALTVAEAAWGAGDAADAADSIVSMPIVVPLASSCDRRDPYVVFMTAPIGGAGTLRAARVDDGALVEIWSAAAADPPDDSRSIPASATTLAGVAYILTCTTDGRLRARSANGSNL